MAIRHSTPADGSFTGQGAAAWNADHLGSSFVNITDYGGSTSTTATNNDAAFAAALATGKGVWVPIGNWPVNQIKLPISGGSRIEGESKLSTVFVFSGIQGKGIITDNQGTSTFWHGRINFVFVSRCFAVGVQLCSRMRRW